VCKLLVVPDSEDVRRQRASSFGAVAAEYERGRPSYSGEAIDWLLGSEPLTVLDLGAGTGKLTAALVQAGHSVTAVEPLAQMREILTKNLPEVRLLEGTAEEIPLGDGSVDGVVAGAAFHWFDHDRALPEIRRVLREPGILGLLGNGFDRSRRWVAQLGQLLGEPELGRRSHWPSAQQLGGYFSVVDQREFAHEQTVDRNRLKDFARSRSSVAILAETQRQRLLAGIDDLWEQEPELVGRGSVELAWITRVGACRGVRRS
jgi:ubiquinone/menaquinone biosynthesis C-methylase UbiE